MKRRVVFGRLTDQPQIFECWILKSFNCLHLLVGVSWLCDSIDEEALGMKCTRWPFVQSSRGRNWEDPGSSSYAQTRARTHTTEVESESLHIYIFVESKICQIRRWTVFGSKSRNQGRHPRFQLTQIRTPQREKASLGKPPCTETNGFSEKIPKKLLKQISFILRIYLTRKVNVSQKNPR